MTGLVRLIRRGKPKGVVWFQWISLAIGAGFGAFFGHVEYGEPWLGALVGTGLTAPIAFILTKRFGA